jgi:hypothetical protein
MEEVIAVPDERAWSAETDTTQGPLHWQLKIEDPTLSRPKTDHLSAERRTRA